MTVTGNRPYSALFSNLGPGCPNLPWNCSGTALDFPSFLPCRLTVDCALNYRNFPESLPGRKSHLGKRGGDKSSTPRDARAVEGSIPISESPVFSPDLDSGNPMPTLPKFVRNCRLLRQASRARIMLRSPRLACYQCQTGNGFWKIGGLSDRPSRRMRGALGPE